MPKNDDIQKLIDALVACDEQPSEEQMSQLRQQLGHKMLRMKRRGRYALFVSLGGILLMLLGYVAIAIAVGMHGLPWLHMAGFTILMTGYALVMLGCLGLLIFRGFGFVWTSHDFLQTAVTELSLQVQRLSDRIDELPQRPSNP